MSKSITRLLFLGTGAADWPEAAPQARAYSSALVDGQVLIDCTHRSIRRIQEYSVDPCGITDVFITHGHWDHFSADALISLSEMRKGAKKPLSVHLDRALAPTIEASGLDVHPLSAGEPVQAAGYTVLPLAANHTGEMPGETCLHYLFTRPKACFLYATDGAWMPYETWRALQKARLDAWIVDCTIGDGHRGDYRIFEHNSLEMVRIMADTLIGQKVLKKTSSVVLTHMARSLHPKTHEELTRTLQPPFVAAYDGYVHEIVR